MDYLDGATLDKAAAIIDELGLDRAELARTLLTLLTQIMLDGGVPRRPTPRQPPALARRAARAA
jgi:hypothetical protein